MFGSKKNNLPPTPRPPTSQQILEDLLDTALDDVAFTAISKDDHRKSLHFPMDSNDPEEVYTRGKSCLELVQNMKTLDHELQQEVNNLQSIREEMKILAQDIRKQAQDALEKRY
ncbi:UPF0449 protein C19orf25 homolog [Orussus abietinus]|uniref:UPF0449 protein C19orf25 homolog n=1 Tax=Orussus abietinus TaxID=222816 RepID=UPI0006257AC8|nr:UPF0449 protein C19orf25 homolog [Orussus abietinus]XP_023289460.1 UPF0449 protein C19orf25 homolog [Orussus abietinus]